MSLLSPEIARIDRTVQVCTPPATPLRLLVKKDFQDGYRKVFSRLGFPLNTRDGLSESLLVKAESKLGIRAPQSLRDYYLVAGREHRFNHAYNHLCAPSEWELHSGKLIFMEENQSVVVWGCTANTREIRESAVSQAAQVSGSLCKWYSESVSCSGFFVFMVHLQASYGGGMPFTAAASATESVMKTLAEEFVFGGRVNGMDAYSREQQVVCTCKWKEHGKTTETRRVFAGATTQNELAAIATALKLIWV